MSASKSEYPERPKKNAKGSSNNSGKKARVFYSQGTPTDVVRENEAHINLGMCSFGHDNAAYTLFRAKYRHNHVPVHEWNKKGRTFIVGVSQ